MFRWCRDRHNIMCSCFTVQRGGVRIQLPANFVRIRLYSDFGFRRVGFGFGVGRGFSVILVSFSLLALLISLLGFGQNEEARSEGFIASFKTQCLNYIRLNPKK